MQSISTIIGSELPATALISINHGNLAGAKTNALFTSRRVRDNLNFAHISCKDCQWLIEGLQAFQQCIYGLDLYGENTWEIKDDILHRIWDDIYHNIRYFGLGDREIDRLVRDIKSYQEIEMNLRNGNLPMGVPIQHLYHLKTCDVRLARSLIFMIAQQPPAAYMAALWNYYDIISEICDDLTDVFEDSYTFNCNRFLIERELYGSAHVRRTYERLLSTIRCQAAELIGSKPEPEVPELYQVCGWIVDKLKEAESLLLFRLLPNNSQERKSSEQRNKDCPLYIQYEEAHTSTPLRWDQAYAQ